MKVHIIGMGIIGSILAWNLHQQDILFSWEDNDSNINAWKATTGLIYPSGVSEDIYPYQVWSRWHRETPPWTLKDITEEAAYWFLSKNPPHQGHYRIVNTVGPLKMGEYPSYHLNGQRFVQETRAFFETQRREDTPSYADYVIEAHGYTKRLDHYVWGWTANTVLDINWRIRAMSSPNRPMLYMRLGRYQLGYANPMPGSVLYYAGSSLIVQKQAKPLNIVSKAQKWKEYVERVTDGQVRVIQMRDYRAGWRPAAAPDDDAWITVEGNHILVKPLWSSGIRHAPCIVDAVLNFIKENN